MAGIAGFVKTSGTIDTLRDMGSLIQHRGPDYNIEYTDDNINLIIKGLKIGYKHEEKELYSDDNVVVAITGYIYNEGELRSFLEENGAEPADDDTMAILIAKLYKKLGTNYNILLKGSFLITIWDKEKMELIIIKDQFGVQPLFYYQTEDGLLFASELKAFLAHPEFKKEFNEKALRPYLIFQAPAIRESFLKGAYKVPEATIFRYKDGNVNLKQYWDLTFEEEKKPIDAYVDDIEKRVKASIDEKTDLSMPIGSFLSGGVDSSYLVSLFKPKNTFTVGYSAGEFSEIDNADALSKIVGSENIHEYLDGDECFNKLGEIQYLLDEPSANPSVVPLYFLSQLAKKSGYSAVLSGEGADEFFGGYFEYIEGDALTRYSKLPKGLRKLGGKIGKKLPTGVKGRNFLMKGGMDVEDWYIGQAKIFSEKEATDLLTADYKDSPTIKDITGPVFAKISGKDDLVKKQYVDFHVWMPNDINLKADRMSMASSVQIIAPLLDNDLLEIAEKLPKKYKVDGENVKVAFRKTAIRNLPEEWAKRPKLGFPVPIRLWVQDDKYYAEIKKAFSSEVAGKFFDRDQLLKILEDHREGKKKNQRKIWTVYMFLVWYNQYFIER